MPSPSPPLPTDGSDRDVARQRRAFLAYARHELRTPLNAILGYSELMIEDAPDLGCERHLPDLERIHANGRTLLDLVNAILDPRKLESESDVDLETYRARIRHELRTPLNSVVGYCEILLEEAEAGEEGEAGSFVEELRRVHAAANNLLAVSDDILRFYAVTERANDPASQEVTSPLAAAIVHSIPALEPDRTEQAAAPSARILVVDDVEPNRDLLRKKLERQGHWITTAANGVEALAQVREDPPDLILLDVMMPVMDGYQALRRLKADEATRHLPVIMISALDELDSVVRCLEMGADEYLPKDCDPILLRTRINACVERKTLRDREQLYLSRIEEEKRRSEELLRVLLPEEIVLELQQTGRVRPRMVEDVAVLFCDVVGFTPYCAERSPDEVVANLQVLVEEFERLALEYGILKIKTVGDSLMATAGLLAPVENAALLCVRYGLALVEAAARLPIGWQVRVGIHCGPVVAGVVGHRQYLFDIWGDTVNTASRVESHGRTGAVNVTAGVWERVADGCDGVSLGSMEIKGKGAMEVFRVERYRGG
jgi:CheY-like chemotaxis protein